jgi:hypothetical protein
MLIARSACSCGLTCRATEHVEQAGLWAVSREAKESGPFWTTKVRALTQVNLIRPRYTYPAAASLPDWVKPVIGREATSASSCRAVRGDWGERVPKDQSRNLGGPAQRRSAPATAGNP